MEFISKQVTEDFITITIVCNNDQAKLITGLLKVIQVKDDDWLINALNGNIDSIDHISG